MPRTTNASIQNWGTRAGEFSPHPIVRGARWVVRARSFTRCSDDKVTKSEPSIGGICSQSTTARYGRPSIPGRRQTMRIICLSMLVVAAFASRATAQDKPIPLPEIRIGGNQPPAAGNQASSAGMDRCVDVEIGSSHAFDCLNRKLREQVDHVNPSLPAAPLDASSQDLKVGTVNVPAVQQQYGKNFGVSVVPYRPPPPIFTIPMGRR